MTNCAESKLSGQRAVVAGGCQGLGMHIGLKLNAAGAEVLILDHSSRERGEEWAEVGPVRRVDLDSFGVK